MFNVNSILFRAFYNPEKNPMPFPGSELQIVPYPSGDIDLITYCKLSVEFL